MFVNINDGEDRADILTKTYILGTSGKVKGDAFSIDFHNYFSKQRTLFIYQTIKLKIINEADVDSMFDKTYADTRLLMKIPEIFICFQPIM